MESNGLNVFLRIWGIVEQDLGHLFITSGSSHFFNKTSLKRNYFKPRLKTSSGKNCLIYRGTKFYQNIESKLSYWSWAFSKYATSSLQFKNTVQ